MQRQHAPPHIFMLQDQRHVHTPSEDSPSHREVELQVEGPGGHVHGLDEVFEAKWLAAFDWFEGLGLGVFGFFFVEYLELDLVRVGVFGGVMGGHAEAVDVGELGVTDGRLARAECVNESHDGQGVTLFQHRGDFAGHKRRKVERRLERRIPAECLKVQILFQSGHRVN